MTTLVSIAESSATILTSALRNYNRKHSLTECYSCRTAVNKKSQHNSQFMCFRWEGDLNNMYIHFFHFVLQRRRLAWTFRFSCHCNLTLQLVVHSENSIYIQWGKPKPDSHLGTVVKGQTYFAPFHSMRRTGQDPWT